MSVHDVFLQTITGPHPLRIRVAESFISRFTGLMLRAPLPPDQGLLLTDCPSVHTMFMRCAIDVVYLDAGGTVLKCVPSLKPWRGSISHTGRDVHGRSHARADHTLELAAGSIVRMSIRPGDRLVHPCWRPQEQSHGRTCSVEAEAAVRGDVSRPVKRNIHPALRQHGAAMIEFVVVGPLLTLLGMAVLQYALLFVAKNQINHASFMAARAGATGNASLVAVQNAYDRALIPLYGGGTNETELNASLEKAQSDVKNNLRIELLNPTRESFDDWHDPLLQNTVGSGKRVIPNANLALRNPADIGSRSGQSIHDANLIKLRITHGYEPKVPLMQTIYRRYLKWLDNGNDSFQTELIRKGRIPVVAHVTLHMQSDAIEPGNPVSLPGAGNSGNPTNPGDPAGTNNPAPDCLTIGCTVDNPPVTPTDPGGGGDNGGSGCTGESCPVCPNQTNP